VSEIDTGIDWLLKNGGAVVRWRTAVELYDDFPPAELKELADDLLALPLTQVWLDRLSLGELEGHLGQMDEAGLARLGACVHGSRNTCLENVLGKLAELGLRLGMTGCGGSAFDQKMTRLCSIFTWHGNWGSDGLFHNTWEDLIKSIFAWGALRTGFGPDEAMSGFLRQKLDDVHKIAADRVFDIYADDAELVGLPKVWAGKRIMKQAVMANYHLPSIHDLYILAYYPTELIDGQTRARIDQIISYVLEPRFQALQDGYGYAWIKARRRCYGWGWSPHLPGFCDGGFVQPVNPISLVQRIELMAHFPRALDSTWFKQALQHLEQFRTETGTYCWPDHYLVDKKVGYYVSGYLMGLGETRRGKAGLEIESTFRMLKIQKLIRDGI